MKNFFKELYPYIIIIVVVFLFKSFIIAPIRVSGDSMYGTLHNNDVMILNKIGYRLKGVKRFDIVVVKDSKGKYLIKRVIGVPGDLIKVLNNQLYINDEHIVEDYLLPNTVTSSFVLDEVIPEGHYFVMGDNRLHSADSRVYGLFSSEDIIGIANYTIFPISRFGYKD